MKPCVSVGLNKFAADLKDDFRKFKKLRFIIMLKIEDLEVHVGSENVFAQLMEFR